MTPSLACADRNAVCSLLRTATRCSGTRAASAGRVGGSCERRGRVERRACSCPQHEGATSRTWPAGLRRTQPHQPLECNTRASTKAGVTRGLQEQRASRQWRNPRCRSRDWSKHVRSPSSPRRRSDRPAPPQRAGKAVVPNLPRRSHRICRRQQPSAGPGTLAWVMAGHSWPHS